MIPAFIADRENRKRRGEFDAENRIGASVHVYGYDIAEENDDEDDDELVMEMKGGSPPPQPTPMEEAQAQIELERFRMAEEQRRAEEQRAREAAEKQERINKAQIMQQHAYNQAGGYADKMMRTLGIDPGLAAQFGLTDLYMDAIENERRGFAEDLTNPMFNTRGAWNDALNTATTSRQSQLKNQLNSAAGDGFEYQYFADTADDDILTEILTQQREDAMQYVDAAKARGQLNDVGYTRAMKSMDNAGQKGMATLQDLGLGVLSGYRGQLRDLRDSELNRVGSLGFGDQYDLNTFNNRLSTLQSDLTGRMRGDIMRATDGTQLFDPSTIISGAGSLQGVYNPTSTGGAAAEGNPLLSAFVQNQQNKPQQTGVF
jgi:hypothetical protein